MASSTLKQDSQVKNKIQRTSKSIEKLDEITNSSKTLKRLKNLVLKSFFLTEKYDVRKAEKKFDVSVNESFFEYNLTEENLSIFNDESTLSTFSFETSIFDDENLLENKNKESGLYINEVIKETSNYIQNLITESIKTIKQDPGTKYNKILQMKQYECIRMLEDIHNNGLNCFEDMKNKIRNEMRENEENMINVVDQFRKKIEDVTSFSKFMQKNYEKLLNDAEKKISLQRQEIIMLKKKTFHQERDDILD